MFNWKPVGPGSASGGVRVPLYWLKMVTVVNSDCAVICDPSPSVSTRPGNVGPPLLLREFATVIVNWKSPIVNVLPLGLGAVVGVLAAAVSFVLQLPGGLNP